jgi:Zn-finger nucleic acid-binding protein
MSKIWDDREKSLENEYFRRKEQELIEKLRAKRAAAEQEPAQASALHCPKCDGTLVEIPFEEVLIDRCEKCHGLWLDAGELERLTQQESGWLSSFWKSLAR